MVAVKRALWLLVVAAGCQAPPVDMSGASAHIRGSINGYGVDVARSVFAVVDDTHFSIYISDRDDLCTVLQKGASPRNKSFFRIGSVADAPQTFPIGGYAYPSGPGSGTGHGDGSGTGEGGPTYGRGIRNAVIARTNDNCLLSGYNQAAWGDFALLSTVDASTTRIWGAFDIYFEVGVNSGEFIGDFVAPICPYATEIPFTAPAYCED
jgi:hypothetical protein